MDNLFPSPACVTQAFVVYILELEVHDREVLRSPPHLHRGLLLPGEAGKVASLGALLLR